MKKKLSIVLAVVLALTLLLTSTTFVAAWGTLVEVKLGMYYYCESGRRCCGPASGVSIGWYYRNEVDRDENGIPDYYLLPARRYMYDHLYDCMNTLGCYTHPTNYGPGFVEMTRVYGYYNFSYVTDDELTNDDEDGDYFPDDFKDIIMDAIDHGWPVALKGNFKNVDVLSRDGRGPWPYLYAHYIAIQGYGYYKFGRYTWGHHIICTDSYSLSHELKFYWDDMTTDGLYLETITIMD